MLRYQFVALVRAASKVCTCVCALCVVSACRAVVVPVELTLRRPQRVDLALNVGEMAVDYTEVAKREHLTGLEVEIRKLNDKLRDIMKEVEYQRRREEEFRSTSESTNSRVQWWSIAQVCALLLCCFVVSVLAGMC